MPRLYFKLLVLTSLFFTLHINASSPAIDSINQIELRTSLTNPDCAPISYTNVAYGLHPQQVYDIHLPDTTYKTSSKVIILVHGGGWRYGDKTTMIPLLNSLRELYPEYTIVNMNYRLANETQYAFPDQFLDIGLLIEHLTLLSSSYQFSPEFGIIGRSAGGHLALMYDAVYDYTDQVKFVSSLAGPTNFSDPSFIQDPLYDEVYDILVNPEVYEPKHASNLLSPLFHVFSETSPTLIFHGKKDNIVPVSNAVDFAEKLKKNSINSKMTLFQARHLDWSLENWGVVYKKLGDFLDRYLSLVD